MNLCVWGVQTRAHELFVRYGGLSRPHRLKTHVDSDTDQLMTEPTVHHLPPNLGAQALWLCPQRARLLECRTGSPAPLPWNEQE
jgi:hypothetical protein